VRDWWTEPKLWLHKLRQLRLGAAVRVSTHDAGLLGKLVSAGNI